MPHRPDRVLIVGCGYLGSALAERLIRAGHPVWGLRRQVERLPSSVQPVEGDLTVPRTLRRLPDVDVAFYMPRADGDGEVERRAVGAEGLRYFLAALEALRLRPRHLFYVSSVEAFGHTDGRWVDEDSSPDEGHPRARGWLEAERAAADAPCKVTVARLGDLYGPGRPGLLEAVLGGAPLHPATLNDWDNPVHREDAAAALAHLLAHRRPEPLYVLADREPVQRLALAGWLAGELGRPAPVLDGACRAGESQGGRVSVRALSERLIDVGHRFIYPTHREGYRGLLRQVR